MKTCSIPIFLLTSGGVRGLHHQSQLGRYLVFKAGQQPQHSGAQSTELPHLPTELPHLHYFNFLVAFCNEGTFIYLKSA
jgi:hypothetical protein